MRRYTLNTGLGALALLGITSACGTLVVVDRNIAGDDLYYSPVRDVVPAVQATSNGANRYVTDADVAAYDQRVNGYRSAGNVTDGEDTRDFSAMQEYYSNASKKGTSLEEIAEMSDSLGIDYNNYESADGLWLGGYSGSDYEQSYAERLIKFHGPTISVGYYSPLYDNLRYSGNWNIYVDGAGYAYVTPRWFSTWAYDPWGWDWNWHGYRHWGLHSSWHWDWYYGAFGNHGYYGLSYYHGHYGWYDPWYYHHPYGYNYGYYGYYGGSGHGHHHDYLNNKNYRYGHRPSSTIGGGGREVNNPRRGGSSNGSQHVNTGNGNGHTATGATPAQTNKTTNARDSYRREYTRPSGARNGQTTGTRTGSSSIRTDNASANKSGSTTSAPVQHSQTRTAAPRNNGGSSRSTYTESSSRQSSRSYSSSGSNKSGSISSSSSSRSYSPSRSSSSSSSSYRSNSGYSSSSSFSSGSHSSSGGSYSSGGGRSSGGSSHSSGGGRSGGGRR